MKSAVASIALSALLAAPAGAAAWQFAPQWSEAYVRLQSADVGDFDHDGRPDLALVTLTGATAVRVEGFASGAWATKQRWTLPDRDPPPRIPVAWPQPGADRLLLIAPNEMIEYAGWPLQETRRVPVPTTDPRRAAVGDIDADGQADLVIAQPGTLVALNLPSGSPKWVIAGGAVDLKLAQFDADPALEIVLTGGPAGGRVLDGASRAEEYVRPGGFGLDLALGRFGDGPGFVGTDSYGLRVYRVEPYIGTWDTGVDTYGAAEACDTDGDGRDEILAAGNPQDELRVIDTATRLPRRAVAHEPGIPFLLFAADFAGDGRCLVALHTGDPSLPPRVSALDVYDAATGLRLHRTPALPAPVGAFGFDDLDGDGDAEAVFASGDDDHLVLRVNDAASGAPSWLAPAMPDAAWLGGARRLLTAQADADPARELVIAANHLQSGRVLVVDGQSAALERSIGTGVTGDPLQGRQVVDAAVGEVAGEPAVVLATRAVFGGPDARLQVFSLATGALLRSSPVDAVSSPVAVFLAQGDADAAREWILVRGDGVRTFDAQEVTLEAAWASPLTVSTAAYDAGSNVIALAGQDHQVHLIHADTRETLGRLDAPSRVRALHFLHGTARRLLVVHEAGLALFDSATGRRLATQPHGGPATAFFTPASLASATGWSIAHGHGAGIAVEHLAGERDAVFTDGFGY